MRRVLSHVTAVAVCALLAGHTHALEVEIDLELEASRDTSVHEKYSDANFGAASELRVTSFNSAWEGDGPGRTRCLFAFDTSRVPEHSTVVNASLVLFQTDGIIYPEGFSVYAANGPWSEDAVTWETQPVSGMYMGHIDNASEDEVTLSSSELVSVLQQWIGLLRPNDGVVVQFVDEYYDGSPNGTRGDTFASRENADFPTPRLMLTVRADAACLADLDGDGTVTISDLGILLAWFEIGDGGDIDLDGDTDISDLGTLLAVYGETCG